MQILKLLSLSLLLLWISRPVVSSAEDSTRQGVERDRFIYFLDTPQYLDMADSLLNEAAVRLETLLHHRLNYKPNVFIVNNQFRFDSLIGGKFPDWGAAAAIPHRKRIVIKSPDQFNLNRSLKELLIHEYSHLALAGRTGFRSAPRWFDEGLAMMVSAEWNWSSNLAMSKAAVFGQMMSLREIEKVNRFNESRAHIAYAQSYLAVTYIYEEYSNEAANIFLDRIAAGASLDEALMASTGSKYADFETEFGLYLKNRFNLLTLILDTMWFWLGLAAILIIGAFIKYRKRRLYYRRWEEEERLQSTDFDYGDPDNPEETDEDEPWRS